MLKIFLPYKLLDSMYSEECKKPKSKWRPWLKILSKQSEIYYSKDDEGTLDADSPFFLFTQNYDIKPIDATKEIEAIKANPYLGLKESSPVFLLDIDEKTAKEIQEQYGYICQSQNALDDTILTTSSTLLSPSKGIKGYSWDMLKEYNNIPCNAITIIDRNLFATEKECKETATDNIIMILSTLIPTKLGKETEFFVSLIIDYKAIKYGHNFETIASELKENVENNIKREFPITIEFVGVDRASDSEQYEKTHNRRIFTNYLYITLEHKVTAFYKNKALASQDIRIGALYSEGLDRGDPTEKSHSNRIKDIAGLKKFGQEHRTQYKIAVNGDSKNKTFYDWKNRLFNGKD